MKRVLSILWTAAALAVTPSAGLAQQQGVTNDTITIGAFGPITGPAAYIGLGGRDGMNLAIKEINAAGGINGRKIADGVRGRHAFADPRAGGGQEAGRSGQGLRAHVASAAATPPSATIDYVKEKGRVDVRVDRVGAAGHVAVRAQPVPRRHHRDGALRRAVCGVLIADYSKGKRIAIMNGREEYPTQRRRRASIAIAEELVRHQRRSRVSSSTSATRTSRRS